MNRGVRWQERRNCPFFAQFSAIVLAADSRVCGGSSDARDKIKFALNALSWQSPSASEWLVRR